MAQVWKYVIPSYGPCIFDLNLPEGAKILSLQLQHGEPCMWALVEKNESSNIKRSFIKVATGEGIGDFYEVDEKKMNFIGTYQQINNVRHVFEIIK